MSEQTHTPETIDYPGHEADMAEQPRDEMRHYRGSGLLEGKVALVTGGDSGIGRAVAVAFAKEGADVAITYLSEHDDAERSGALVREAGRRAVAFPGDLADPDHVRFVAQRTVEEFGRVDVLVNNAAYQQPVDKPEDVTREQWRHTFAVNIEAPFFLTQALLPHMPPGSAIINTASITGLRGSPGLLDYSATKGALIALTYALSQALTERGIRVNAVAPGPVWTPLIPATFDEEKAATFGSDVPYGRPAEPDEIAPSYVFFASATMSSYYSGEVLAPVGGQTMPG
ncbi:MAG: SDR family oxidoreductase [Candidatus Nanopelagicales bacterium]|jgi:NAD(P)-dependent dehydrogenase (short-subunit alcohol dehydrogenase family)|nr:SDR family oxidoreductase [Candidatus Nanopelagicales bacterium]